MNQMTSSFTSPTVYEGFNWFNHGGTEGERGQNRYLVTYNDAFSVKQRGHETVRQGGKVGEGSKAVSVVASHTSTTGVLAIN